MSKKVGSNLDLVQNEIQNARLQNLAAAPGSPVLGQVYYDTVLLGPYTYNGSSWDKGVIVYGAVTGQTAYGASSANGSASSASHSDHVHGTPALSGNTPQAVSIAGSAVVGTGTAPSKDDHVHAGPGFAAPATSTAFGASAVTGTATTTSHSDHTHGTPTHVGTDHSAISLSSLSAPTGDIAFASHKITGLADPTNAQDAATKAYADNLAAGLSLKGEVHAATTANLVGTYTAGSAGADGGTGVGATFTMTATGVLSIDGYTHALGDRFLFKNQTAQTQNGIYQITTLGAVGVATVFTRVTDYDNHVAGQVIAGNLIYVVFGGQGGTAWAENLAGTATVPIEGIKIGSDNIGYAQFSGGAAYTASNGVLLTALNFTFAPLTNGGLQTAAGGASILLQTNSGLGLAAGGIAVGAGTGITVGTNTVSIDTTVVARKYATTLSTSATSYTVTHNLGTLDVIVQVYLVADGSEVIIDNLRATTNTVTINFATAPSANAYRVVVLG